MYLSHYITKHFLLKKKGIEYAKVSQSTVYLCNYSTAEYVKRRNSAIMEKKNTLIGKAVSMWFSLIISGQTYQKNENKCFRLHEKV